MQQLAVAENFVALQHLWRAAVEEDAVGPLVVAEHRGLDEDVAWRRILPAATPLRRVGAGASNNDSLLRVVAVELLPEGVVFVRAVQRSTYTSSEPHMQNASTMSSQMCQPCLRFIQRQQAELSKFSGQLARNLSKVSPGLTPQMEHQRENNNTSTKFSPRSIFEIYDCPVRKEAANCSCVRPASTRKARMRTRSFSYLAS